MKMTNSEMRILKRQMQISELEDKKFNDEKEALLRALNKNDDWIRPLIFSLLGVLIAMFMNYMGYSEILEKWLR